jgi:hypothetical protein
MRPRQNSVFIGSSASFLPGGRGTLRRTKSAFDLQFSVLSKNHTLDSSDEQDTLNNLKSAKESTKLLQLVQKNSVCQVGRTETIKSYFRNKRMSVCHSDISLKSEQRDRGMSVCQLDQMGIITRPDCGSSICQFDRMDVID